MKQYILCILLFCAQLNTNAQSITIDLTLNKENYTPANFHIAEVKDNRTFTSKIGKTREGDVLLNKGVEKGLMDFTQHKSTVGLPITMHINKLEIMEKNLGSKRQFDLVTDIAYYTGSSKLVEYSGKSYAQLATNAAPYIEKLIRQAFNDNLKQFDTWVGKNQNTISAEPEIEVNVFFANLNENKNHISYSKTKKLYITDFKSDPDMESPGAAATMSGVGMKYKSSTLRNKTTVDVTISVYFDKAKSWMKANGKNVTTLMHEQRHFDITAFKACELKERIESGYAEFTPSSYQTQLSELLRQTQEEGAEMQNTYDRETDHGTIIDEQEKWNKKIDALLKQQSCYN